MRIYKIVACSLFVILIVLLYIISIQYIDSNHELNVTKHSNINANDKNSVIARNTINNKASDANIVSSSNQNNESNGPIKREKFATMEEEIAAAIRESKKNQDEMLIPYEDLSNLPEIYLRNKYEEKTNEAKSKVSKLLEQFIELEKINGTITHTHPNGDKNSVDVHDDKGIIIGKLVYLSNDWVNQIVEWKDGKLNGMMAFYSKNENLPYKIYNFKDNKLDGPYYEFERKGENKGALVQYVEFKDQHYFGLCLGWTPEGVPLKGCRVITEPKLKTGLP